MSWELIKALVVKGMNNLMELLQSVKIWMFCKAYVLCCRINMSSQSFFEFPYSLNSMFRNASQD